MRCRISLLSDAESIRRGVPQSNVAPLDLSGVDLSKPSGERLRRDHKWTLFLILKLSVPVILGGVSCRCALLPPCGLVRGPVVVAALNFTATLLACAAH